MAFHIEDIKKFITDYFTNDVNGVQGLGRNKNTDCDLFNKNLFELEVLIQQIKTKQGIGLNLNSKIFSPNIFNSINTVNPNQYFKPVDYQLNFFYYLSTTYNIRFELHEYIKAFVNAFRAQLYFPDIQITDSGATRIFTNIRFAVNDLRNLGLILRHNEFKKRIFLPSVFGLFVLIYIFNNSTKLENKTNYKPFESLKLINDITGYYSPAFNYDSNLIWAIKDFANIDLMEVIGGLPNLELSDPTKEALQEIIKKYTDYILAILEISNDGIKIKKGNEDRIKKFISKAENENIIPDIQSKLLKLLKELKN